MFRRLFIRDNKKDLELRRILGFRPKKKNVYQSALIHKSAGYKYAVDCRANNERLEFLGDAVLDSIIAEYLFLTFKDKDEGFLTKTKSKIVKRKHMDQLSLQMGLEELIKYRSGNNNHQHIYGNALEALIGAVYLDKGYGGARKFVVKQLIEKHLDMDKIVAHDSDHKSQLIEWGQKNKKTIVFESFEKYVDQNKNPIFASRVLVGDEVLGTGEGNSKKEAEQHAARSALKTHKHP